MRRAVRGTSALDDARSLQVLLETGSKCTDDDSDNSRLMTV
eukprot:CAMPEP_0177218128 /NCGR_PEP_ID=MMETSP0367-20130122/35650_1 /TAXON_ID=447022 ORGANISM="Scrippsiella hangoei-like, Strain SHHI-4" /NCGR_SAMPLE_ID=MMETSP0367 /ASSEMBLY_ACC=CAM_ASM_000362 /LENGTH=40 /DNA_ID= /DNA_START= /DNA_END= /DNA_ORIENTATION=